MLESSLVQFVLFPLAAYLVGSIPTGYIIGRARGVDVRTQGSGNIGATNVGRVLGRKWGYLCFLLDVLKGFAPVLAAGLLLHDVTGGVPPLDHQAAWLLVGMGTILGHIFTVFLKFKGGKGVATSLGAVLGFYPYFTWAGLAAFGLWIVVVLIWRYVSLASIVAAVAFPLLFVGACLALGRPVGALWPLLAFASAMALLVVVRHRANVRRLLDGTENKIGQKK